MPDKTTRPRLTYLQKITLLLVVIWIVMAIITIGFITGGIHDLIFIVLIIGALPLEWKLVFFSVLGLALAGLYWWEKQLLKKTKEEASP